MILGLIEKSTGYNDDPSGPFGLSRGGLVRDLRPAPASNEAPEAPATQTVLEYSRDGRGWETFRVFNYSLRTGDVEAIREELFAVKPVPPFPTGATRFVWCYREGDGYSYAEGKPPETYRSTFWVPTRWHSVRAYDAAGESLGYFSPHYPDWGWTIPHGVTVMDSPFEAQRALRRI